jgi:hypothetical protein
MDARLMQATANEIISTFGKRCTVTHLSGKKSTTKAAVTRPSKELITNSGLAEDTLVCWVQGKLNDTPGPGDVIKVGNFSYTVFSVNKISPDGVTAICYAFYVRT